MAVVCFVKLLMYIFGIDKTGSREKESTLGARGVSSEGSGFCQVFMSSANTENSRRMREKPLVPRVKRIRNQG